MSVKLKISYNTEEELAGVIQQLFPLVKSWKISRTQKGRYRNAYVEIDPEKLMYVKIHTNRTASEPRENSKYD